MCFYMRTLVIHLLIYASLLFISEENTGLFDTYIANYNLNMTFLLAVYLNAMHIFDYCCLVSVACK